MWKLLSALSPLTGYWLVMASLALISATLGVIEQCRFAHNYTNSSMPYIGSLFDLSGYFAFGCIAAHLVLQFTLTSRWRCIATVVVLALYVSSYFVLSFQGKYHASRSGQHRWDSIGLAVIDQHLWHAKGVFWRPFRTVDGQDTYQATYLGYFYSPLIVMDRAVVHRTLPLFNGQQ